MKYIEVFCVDKALAKKVVIELERELTNLSFSVKGVDPSDCLLSEAVKIVKTYPAISIDKTSLMFLESAREFQVQKELVDINRENKDFLIKSGSYLLDMYLYYTDVKVKRMILRYLIKKMTSKPDHIIYLETDMKAYLKRRISMESAFKTEDSLRGPAARWRIIKYPKILQKINSKHGINVSIIKTEDNPSDLTQITKLAIQEILKDGNDI